MKKLLIKNLENDVYCRLKPSKKHGVGVFAIRDIPKNTDPFKLTGSKCENEKVLSIKKEELKNVHHEVKKMVRDFYHEEDDTFHIPYKGINGNNISYYLNTTDNPNVGFISKKDCSMVVFITIRKIKKGEELLINYDDY